MRDAAPDGAERRDRVGGRAARARAPGLACRSSSALEAFEQALGVKPLLVRVGGTLPIVPALADKGIPTVLTRLRACRSRTCTRRTRSFLVRYFEQGVDTAAALYTRVRGTADG